MPSANGHGPKRAILYARVSTDEKARSGYFLAQQLEALRGYALREGYEVLEEVTDSGQSGASLARPGMDRVRDLVAAGEVSVVLSQDRDRFAREPAYLYLLKKEFEEHGCSLRALNDHGGDRSPEGELTDGILDQLAKFERAKTAERTRRGKHRKLRQGKLVAGYSAGYGYRYNAARDGLAVDDEQMCTVRRIFEMVARGESFYSLIKTFEREGLRSPRGQERWNQATLRNLILSDLYRPHTMEEVAELVTPEVAAALDPDKRYGIAYYGKKQITKRQVSEGTGDERRYRHQIKARVRDREQWLAIPVPDSGLPRELVDAAREAIKNNHQTSRSSQKTWELPGNVLRCAECGYGMQPKISRGSGKRKKRLYYYRCGRRYNSKNGFATCEHAKHHRAEEVEAQAWRYVRELFEDPEQLRDDLEHMIELEQERTRRNPEQDAKIWLDKLAEVARQRSRAQGLAIEGLLDHDELRAKLASLDETRKMAERELTALGDHQERLAMLKRDKEAVLEYYSGIAPEALDSLDPEERRTLYGMLRMRAVVYPDGEVVAELDGAPRTLTWPTASAKENTC